MRIETFRTGPNREVAVIGTLDWRAAPDLGQAASSALGAPRVLIDLTEVEAMDSAGTGTLIAAHLRARRAGTRLAVLTGEAVTDVVGSVLDAASAGGALPVFTDRTAARAWLSEG